MESRGNLRRHTASLAPRGSAAYARRTGGTDPSWSRQESFALIVSYSGEQPANYAPKGHIGRTTGHRSITTGPVSLQTSRDSGLA
ncbi:hypothetical protein [Tunturiibacter lichenicola]|uniref:hypothetical protein n=1 Tax=Tunturiibacter lichenicola TaxID=2051959 RepID=UPI0021B299CE|nr:hypothetical protein [Edaphobacter lichenicola]